MSEIKHKPDEFIIRPIKPEDKEMIMALMVKSFCHLMPEAEIIKHTDFYTDYIKSIVIEWRDEIVGFYLLGNRQLRAGIADEELGPDNIDNITLHIYDKLIGVEGVALVIKPTYRGLGLASRLKDYTRTLGADYIWGIQYRTLDNLQYWLRRRKLVAQGLDQNITVEDFNK
jgi:GNAT superfamily N-acetyltransferase